jgi:pimeloyl-ACP methyl ester carboxylesterase
VLDPAGVGRAVVVTWCDMGESLILAAEHPGTDEGWAKETRGYWLRDWTGYLDFFFAQCFTEPHPAEVAALCPRVRCPVLAIHGTEDAQVEASVGADLAAELGGRLVLLEGAGHAPRARDPVKVNTLVADVAWAGPGHPHLDPGPCAGPGGPCTCPRPSSSATPAATWPSPASCAGWSPAWRSTGWPRTR